MTEDEYYIEGNETASGAQPVANDAAAAAVSGDPSADATALEAEEDVAALELGEDVIEQHSGPLSLFELYRQKCGKCSMCTKDDCGKCLCCLYNNHKTDQEETKVCLLKVSFNLMCTGVTKMAFLTQDCNKDVLRDHRRGKGSAIGRTYRRLEDLVSRTRPLEISKPSTP